MRTLFVLSLACLGVMMAGCRKGNDVLELVKARYSQMEQEADYVSVNGQPVAKKIRFVEEGELPLPDTAGIKQIALIRHGEPDLYKKGRFTYEEAKQYMKNYDSVGILLPDEPFFMVEDEDEILFYTSTLNRARATANYLFGPDREVVESEDFREFERSLDNRRIRMKLPLRYWTITARIEWLLGINRDGIESFGEAKARARRGAEKLESDSRQHDKIVLVAHGFLNKYLKRYLQEQGWEVVRDGGSDYFATTILAKVEVSQASAEGVPASVSQVD